MREITFVTLLSVILVCLSPAHAELIDNGGGLIYDTDRNITWYNPDLGPMTWSQAVSWVAGLKVTNANAANITGWRLPSALNEDGTGPCNDYNCTGSELGHLYYTELGNSAYGPLTNTGPFVNLAGHVYWTALEWVHFPGNAWAFSFSYGLQGFGSKDDIDSFSVLAVHDGNVGQSLRLVKKGVLADLEKLLTETTDQQNIVDLYEAIRHLTASLNPSWWSDDYHLNPKYGVQAFFEAREAVAALNDLYRRGLPVEDFIDSLTEVDRALARNGINSAVAGNGAPKKITKARDSLARAIETSIDSYSDVWSEAIDALIRVR
jgi:hypothetical protein